MCFASCSPPQVATASVKHSALSTLWRLVLSAVRLVGEAESQVALVPIGGSGIESPDHEPRLSQLPRPWVSG